MQLISVESGHAILLSELLDNFLDKVAKIFKTEYIRVWESW